MSSAGGLQTRPDFFVSYTEVDGAWAEWIAWVLESVGWRVVIQAWDFGPGSHFVAEMHQASQDAERTIAVLSETYLGSVFGAGEWQAAWAADPIGRQRKLLVVRIEDCDRPGLLSQIVSVDIFDTNEQTARDRILNAASGATSMIRMKPSVAPQFPSETRGVAEAKPFPGTAEVRRDGDQYLAWKDLVIRTKSNSATSISITYAVSGEGLLESTVDLKYAEQIVPAISNELQRMRVRYGLNSVATIEGLARQFSEIFLPSEVVTLVQQGTLDRLQVIAEGSAPNLPWELAHDGDNFLALKMSVLHATRKGQISLHRPRGRVALMVEGVPDLYVVAPGYFPPDSDLSIRKDDSRVTKIRVRDAREFIRIIAERPCDLLFLDFHTTVGRNAEPIVLIDEPIDLRYLIRSIAQTAPEVVVLSGCETAGASITYDRNSAFQTSLALHDGYVLGVIGWLGIATAERFADLFTQLYLDTKNVEHAVLRVRQELFRETHEDWWSYSLFGPA